ncbi:winged helix-turn-helix transcriptional regulator [Micromonospora viridifaciens]|uniref:winged helix-turn-helix transcriptional regulator n=1 Tax=Micromonospora viridifaciens TaxID=1881 RepID=UPI000B5AE715|nr:helix-turn-helix domain-containing protein [Micromonospora viridifaciens]
MTVRPEVSRTPRACDGGLARAFAFLGKRWNGVLLGTLANGPAGFAELGRALPGISESVLSDRLGELCRVGLVSRTVREGPPLGVSYQLTERGAALVPALDALARWAHENLPAEAGRAGGC